MRAAVGGSRHHRSDACVFRNAKTLRRLRHHAEIAFISAEEHELLDRASRLIGELVDRRHHLFDSGSASFRSGGVGVHDGGGGKTSTARRRLANVERLFTLAARFESSGTHLIRDFVRYVEEFEAIGSRESEGTDRSGGGRRALDDDSPGEGLEFPVVIIPDLQRLSRRDRQLGAARSSQWFDVESARTGAAISLPVAPTATSNSDTRGANSLKACACSTCGIAC
jgi:hypothetical protein